MSRLTTESLPLNQTKLFRPRVNEGLIPRPRLLERLDRGREHPFILVVAPAGYGKTTQVAAWLDSYDWPSTWLSLDEEDSDLNLFLFYVLAAIHSIFPNACSETADLLNSAAEIPTQLLSRTLVNELTQIEEDFLLVLDDYHCLRGMAVHDLVAELLRYPPPPLHLVLVSRSNPPLPLTELRARNKLAELRREDLRFTELETTAFLEQELGISVADGFADALLKRVEGWVAGMRLAVLSLRHSGRLTLKPAHLRGNISYVTDYLMSEIMESQPTEIQDYMLHTSILDRFCAPLCQAVVETKEADIDGEAFINWLVGSNLFVIPLDNERIWYRYHHLFQELLQHRLAERLSEDKIADLHSRASTWFAENGQIVEALQHAITADNIEFAIALVAQYRHDLMNNELWQYLNHWLLLFPSQVIEEEPELLLTKAWSLYNQGNYHQMLIVLEQAEELLACSKEESIFAKCHQAEIDAMRSEYVLVFENDAVQAVALARQALSEVPDTWFSVRGLLYVMLGYGYLMLGEMEQGFQVIIDALNTDRSGNSTFRGRLLMTLCYMYRSSANMLEMRQAATNLLALGQASSLSESIAYGHFFLGCFHYQRNELVEAEEHLAQAAGDRKIAQIVNTVNSTCALALTYQAQNKPDQALATAESTIAFLGEIQNVDLLPQLQGLQAQLALHQEHLGDAGHWAQQFDPYPLSTLAASYIPPELTLAKVLLAQESSASQEQAAELLAKLYEHVLTDKRFRIEVLSLQALLSERQGYQARALDKLEEAVRLAEPGGFIRLFVDLGPGMAILLDQLRTHGTATYFINQILKSFPESKIKLSSNDQGGLVDPLTTRELDVLSLLAQQLSNKEIAEKLVISSGTVKQHTYNIYQKLGVNTRWRAVTKATELGILKSEPQS